MLFNICTLLTFFLPLIKADFWLGDITHDGLSPYAPDPSTYQIFRNVRDFGATGDGTTDDTNAIVSALTAGSRCGQGCGAAGSTTTPAVVYFPNGTYLISSSLQVPYFTQLVGDYNTRPTLLAAASFSGSSIVDSDPYNSDGTNWFPSVNNFFRDVRNLIFDTRNGPDTLFALHWQVSQATSLTHVDFYMRQGSNQVGVFIENGSLGTLTDLYFNGATGLRIGNQQYTLRGLRFENCALAIDQLWDWGASLFNTSIINCQVGISSATGTTSKTNQFVNGMVAIDVYSSNTPILFNVSGTNQGNFILENIVINNVQNIVYQAGQSIVQGSSGSSIYQGWSQGSSYTGTSSTSQTLTGAYQPAVRPSSLITSANNFYFGKARPQYQSASVNDFISVKANGAKGDGSTDDTAALQNTLNTYASSKIIYIPHGIYLVTSTISIPVGTRIVGEAYSVIMGSGTNFADASNPQVVVRVGNSGDSGLVEITDMWFSTRGPAAGAVVLEWNVQASAQGSTSMHGSHIIIGGFAGTNLQTTQCTANQSFTDNCRSAFLGMHVTPSASVYLEETWIWTADHDLESPTAAQISIYTGRGLLVESTTATWLYGTASEHAVLYQYNFAAASNVLAGQVQTETPYYAGTNFPSASTISPPNNNFRDPTFSNCGANNPYCDRAWGLYSDGSSNLRIYGYGAYSFFDNYTQTCIDSRTCQASIVQIESTSNSYLYNLNTIGSYSMIDSGLGTGVVSAADNLNGGGIAQGIAIYST